MINFQVPFNQTSFGQTAFCLFREMVKLADIALIPMHGNFSLDTFDLDEEEVRQLQESVANGSDERFDPSNTYLKLFNIASGKESIGPTNNLYTFHETDGLTPSEVNILNHCDKIFVSAKYTKEVFDSQLADPSKVIYAPLGFDNKSFKIVNNPKKRDDIIVFSIKGKYEKRKNTARVIRSWAKVFGGNPNYRLDCSVYNAFMQKEEWEVAMKEMFPKTPKPWNINFLPFFKKNSEYNTAMNEADIDLTGMSGGEGFNLPLFQSLCLGKQAIVLNAHAHKDFCNAENSLLVEPKGKMDSTDGKFFIKGGKFSQGNFFNYSDDDFEQVLRESVHKAKEFNHAGAKLAEEFTYEKTAKIILQSL